jgi:hypothetical protein
VVSRDKGAASSTARRWKYGRGTSPAFALPQRSDTTRGEAKRVGKEGFGWGGEKGVQGVKGEAVVD